MSGENDKVYTRYTQYVRSILQTGNISDFKRQPAYTYMLEHVLPLLGRQYLDIVRRSGVPNNEIVKYCSKNDRIGSPILTQYDTFAASPTSLRYIRHALLILDHCKKAGVMNPSFVEVGCGYGGLALAIDHFSSLVGINVKSYTMIDLEHPSGLQQLYLSKHTSSFPITFRRADAFGSDVEGSDNFLISCYCFSEISAVDRQNYVKTLFPKCSHGFILWNMIPLYDVGKQVTVEPESPLTCPVDSANPNCHVYF
jgi:hypothetical protein